MELKKYDFLHIGKTGGNFFRNIVKINDKNKIIQIYSHYNSILNESRKNKVIFFVRDPVKRYISGFISRLRKG